MTINVLSGKAAAGPNLWTAGGYQFGVIVDANDDVVALQFQNYVEIARTITSLTVTDLAHGNPALGVDADGYIHIASNNSQPSIPGYIVSDLPLDISAFSSGVTRLAGVNAYSSYAYFQFRPFANNDLLLIFRSRDLTDASEEGVEIAAVLEQGNTNWTDMGEIAHGATGTEDAFYRNHPVVEPPWGPHPDRVHVFGAWDSLYSGEDVNNFSYLYSDDRCATWHAIDGTLLTTPISETSASGIACRTGVSVGPGSGQLYSNGAALDADFNPCAMLADESPAIQALVRYNGSTWDVDTTSLGSTYGGGQTANIIRHRRDLWILARRASTTRAELRRVASPNETVVLTKDLPSGGWFTYCDPIALRDNDVVAVLEGDDTNPQIRTFGNHARRVAN